MSEAGTIMGMKALLWAYKIFGLTGFRLILLPVMTYYYCRRRNARQASQQFLQQISPYLPKEQSLSLSTFRHFLMFGEIILDKFLAWMGEILKQDVIFEMPEVLEQIENSQRGGIIIMSHLGNMEVCSAFADQLPDISLTLLVYTQHAEKFNSLMSRLNNSSRIKLLEVTEMTPATAMILSERVEAGEYIVIAGDRTPVTGQSRISMVNFLGRKAPMPQGAFILAGLLTCPIYLMFCLKQQNQYHIYVELFSQQLTYARKQRQEIIDNAVQRYADRLAFYCVKSPLQWFNFYLFWPDNNDANTPDI